MNEPILTGPYAPVYAPWFGPEFTKRYKPIIPYTLVSPDRCYILERLLLHTATVPGDVIECGVYKGGTAKLLAQTMHRRGSEKKLYLYDTFEGMPDTDAKKDNHHKKGDFADTSLEAVVSLIGPNSQVEYRKGFIPDTFSESPLMISFAHVDVDIYKSVIDCCDYIWPRLSQGGAMVFDDYGFDTCKGALDAVNDFFAKTTAFPICLPTGQAIVYKA